LAFGPRVDNILDGSGDIDLYVFDGARGESVLIEAIDNSSMHPQLCMTIFDPSGEPIQPELCQATRVSVGMSLPQTGTFSILVRERDDEFGEYSIRAMGPLTCDGQSVTVVGTNGDDILEGTEEDDVIHGFGGHDIIHGLAGDDIICGGGGNDVLLGEAGNDQLFGGNGNDSLNGSGGDDVLRGEGGTDVCDGGGQAESDTAAPSCEAAVRSEP
jgi:Ca2+-binding RTX toxin-like protein